jgi:hypothetical protein
MKNKDDMKNMKMVHYCWDCKKEHEALATTYDFLAPDKSVMCECGGYVVTRSGKVQIGIIPIVPVWKIDDGERHWIAAKDIDELKTCYKDWYGDELLEDADITQVTGADLNDAKFWDDEEMKNKRSLIDFVREANHFPAQLASSLF